MKIHYGLITLTLSVALASSPLWAHTVNLSQRDAHVSGALVGTWLDPADNARSEITYHPDGQITMVFCGGDVRPDRGDIVYGAWEVRNGYLRQEVQEPDQGRLPLGLEVTDKVVSVSKDRHILITSEGGVVIRIRKPKRYSGSPCS